MHPSQFLPSTSPDRHTSCAQLRLSPLSCRNIPLVTHGMDRTSTILTSFSFSNGNIFLGCILQQDTHTHHSDRAFAPVQTTLACCCHNTSEHNVTRTVSATAPSSHDRALGVAQWLERWTGDPKIEGSNLIRVKKVVLTRCHSVNVPNPSVYTQAVVHVRVW